MITPISEKTRASYVKAWACERPSEFSAQRLSWHNTRLQRQLRVGLCLRHHAQKPTFASMRGMSGIGSDA